LSTFQMTTQELWTLTNQTSTWHWTMEWSSCQLDWTMDDSTISSWQDSNHQDHRATSPFENPVWQRTMIHPNMSDTYQPKFNMILNHGMKFMSTWLDHGWFHNALTKVPSSPQCQMWSNCFKTSH
jgi:hypothetical protein